MEKGCLNEVLQVGTVEHLDRVMADEGEEGTYLF
jgi:hypothetical protein